MCIKICIKVLENQKCNFNASCFRMKQKIKILKCPFYKHDCLYPTLIEHSACLICKGKPKKLREFWERRFYYRALCLSAELNLAKNRCNEIDDYADDEDERKQ